MLAVKPSSVNAHFSGFRSGTGGIHQINRRRQVSLPELLIVLGLAQGNPSVEDVFAVLVVQGKKLEWDKLLALCRAYNTTRYLGFLLELLNFESHKSVDSRKIKENGC